MSCARVNMLPKNRHTPRTHTNTHQHHFTSIRQLKQHIPVQWELPATTATVPSTKWIIRNDLSKRQVSKHRHHHIDINTYKLNCVIKCMKQHQPKRITSRLITYNTFELDWIEISNQIFFSKFFFLAFCTFEILCALYHVLALTKNVSTDISFSFFFCSAKKSKNKTNKHGDTKFYWLWIYCFFFLNKHSKRYNIITKNKLFITLWQ